MIFLWQKVVEIFLNFKASYNGSKPYNLNLFCIGATSEICFGLGPNSSLIEEIFQKNLY